MTGLVLDTSENVTVADVIKQQLPSSGTQVMTSPPNITDHQVGLVFMDTFPSTICKKEIKQSDVEVKRVKNRLLEIVRNRFGLENKLWLN